jgi:feruloyl-CoA synthase
LEGQLPTVVDAAVIVRYTDVAIPPGAAWSSPFAKWQGTLAEVDSLVICGQDGDCVTAMVWLAPSHAHRIDADGVPEDFLRAELEATMQRLADEGGGSSQCVERLLVLTEPARLDAGEITDKGCVNQAAVRDRRADLVAHLSADPRPSQVVAR